MSRRADAPPAAMPPDPTPPAAPPERRERRAAAPARRRVALLGFGDFERDALASYFRLAGARDATGNAFTYRPGRALARCDFIVAVSDHAASVQTVLDAGSPCWASAISSATRWRRTSGSPAPTAASATGPVAIRRAATSSSR